MKRQEIPRGGTFHQSLTLVLTASPETGASPEILNPWKSQTLIHLWATIPRTVLLANDPRVGSNQ